MNFGTLIIRAARCWKTTKGSSDLRKVRSVKQIRLKSGWMDRHMAVKEPAWENESQKDRRRRRKRI